MGCGGREREGRDRGVERGRENGGLERGGRGGGMEADGQRKRRRVREGDRRCGEEKGRGLWREEKWWGSRESEGKHTFEGDSGVFQATR